MSTIPYAYIFLLLLLAWPYVLADSIGWMIFVFVLNTALLVWVARQTSSPQFTFMDGLKVVSGGLRSGCANFTIVYIFPLLAVFYLIAVIETLVGILKGKEWVAHAWMNTVSWCPSFRGPVKDDRATPVQ